MKRSSLLLSLLLCGTMATNAQDTYWAMYGNKVYNTATGTLSSSSLHSDFDFDNDYNVIFNGAGEQMFTGGPSSYFSVSNLGQVLPIPSECRKYVSLETYPVATPHGHYLRTRTIDLSAWTNNNMTTSLPSTSSYTYLHSGADAVYYGAVAAKLNTNGTRYFYHLNVPASSPTATLKRYEISSAGVVNSTPTTISTLLPYGSHLEMAQDGKSLAYINSSGSLVTVILDASLGTVGNYTTYTGYSVNTTTEFPSIESLVSGATRSWYVNNSTNIYVATEGNSSIPGAITGSNGEGANSSIAVGRDGNIYFAYSSTAGPGTLYKFDPANVSPFSVINVFSNTYQASGAQVNVFAGPSSAYYFGNQIAGEDVNAATEATAPPTFDVAGQTSTSSTATDIYLCNENQLILNGKIFSNGYNFVLKAEEGTFSGGIFTPVTSYYSYLQTADANHEIVDLDLYSVFPAFAPYNGYIRVTIYTQSSCGTITATAMVFNLTQITALLEYYMVGPSDIYAGGAPACIGHQGLPSTHDGLQKRIDNIADVNTARPIQPVNSSPVPCADGWLGAYSVGFNKGTLTTNNVNILGYEVNIDEYTSGGTYVQNILNKTPATFPVNYSFNQNSTSPFYFLINYSTIADDNYYHLTVTVNTQNCGDISKDAYFKILEGSSSFKPGQDPTGIDNTPKLERVTVFPNPAKEQVTVNWAALGSNNATLSLYNTMGQIVLQKDLPQEQGMNKQTVKINDLASGMYYYILHTGSKDHKGTLHVE